MQLNRIRIGSMLAVLLIPFVLGSCILNQNKTKDWAIEFVVKKKFTVDSYYVDSKGEGIRMIQDTDCNVQLEKYEYDKEEALKIYNVIALLQNKNINWGCSNDGTKDGINATILFHEGNVEKRIEFSNCVMDQSSTEFLELLFMFENTAESKGKQILLESHIVPPPPLPN